MQRDQRRLAGGGVLAGRLAHRLGVRREVEQVVGELEGEADALAEFGAGARGPRPAPPR